MEHALAEERRAEADAIEPADQFAVLIGLDRMGAAELEQLAVEPADVGVDPGLVAIGAGRHHGVEGAVGDHLERVAAHRLGEAARDDERRRAERLRARSGSTQNSVSASRLSAIGNSPIE